MLGSLEQFTQFVLVHGTHKLFRGPVLFVHFVQFVTLTEQLTQLSTCFQH